MKHSTVWLWIIDYYLIIYTSIYTVRKRANAIFYCIRLKYREVIFPSTDSESIWCRPGARNSWFKKQSVWEFESVIKQLRPSVR